MKLRGGNMLKKYKSLLEEYNHSKPIIYSHIENQQPYEIFYNAKEGYGILFTNFDYHYCFGSIPSDTVAFRKALHDYHKKHEDGRIILYGPNKVWDAFLDKWVQELNGGIQQRYLYDLNTEEFKQYDPQNRFIKLEFKQEEGALKKYPQASIYLHGKLVSYSRAIMLGNNEAELDVWTCEEYRKQGMAFDACLVLIEYLLQNDIKPNWTCWGEKESSHNLAKKLGYKLRQVMNCYIWNEDCKTL